MQEHWLISVGLYVYTHVQCTVLLHQFYMKRAQQRCAGRKQSLTQKQIEHIEISGAKKEKNNCNRNILLLKVCMNGNLPPQSFFYYSAAAFFRVHLCVYVCFRTQTFIVCYPLYTILACVARLQNVKWKIFTISFYSFNSLLFSSSFCLVCKICTCYVAMLHTSM